MKTPLAMGFKGTRDIINLICCLTVHHRGPGLGSHFVNLGYILHPAPDWDLDLSVGPGLECWDYDMESHGLR
jgi:hypothetical protein